MAGPSWMMWPAEWPGQVDLLVWAEKMGPFTAAMLLLAGLVYLAFGIQLFRMLVTLNAALLGAYIGGWAGAKMEAYWPCLIIGIVLAAALAWPLMRYAVALMGGIYGALLGASLWRAVGLEPMFAWAGAMTGLVFLGMLAFILFRGSIMMYTSLQGAVMLVFGLLGLLFKYQEVGPAIENSFTAMPYLLPMAIFIPAIGGLIYQQTQYGAAEPQKK